MSKYNKKIYVTKPSLPELKDFIPYLEKIWNSKILTNNGPFHQELEKRLTEYLGVKHVCLFNNGTVALQVALKALKIKGEVITTPFSFVATSNAIVWNNSVPVFCDIDPQSLNLDPAKIEALITSQTKAIMPVHVYGNPCDNEAIMQIAEKYKLKVIYDAAHAFNVRKNGESILNWGDLSVLSFHATKVFNTFEGGAIVCHTEEMKQQIDDLKNFGIRSETEVADIGINGKLNELQAAIGIIQLKNIAENIRKRKEIDKFYRAELASTKGITCLKIPENVEWNFSYFPILIDDQDFDCSRDELYLYLKKNNIYGRRYFYPLISQFPSYRDIESANSVNLPVASRITEEIICLPIYSQLEKDECLRIIDIIKRI